MCRPSVTWDRYLLCTSVRSRRGTRRRGSVAASISVTAKCVADSRSGVTLAGSYPSRDLAEHCRHHIQVRGRGMHSPDSVTVTLWQPDRGRRPRCSYWPRPVSPISSALNRRPPGGPGAHRQRSGGGVVPAGFTGGRGWRCTESAVGGAGEVIAPGRRSRISSRWRRRSPARLATRDIAPNYRRQPFRLSGRGTAC